MAKQPKKTKTPAKPVPGRSLADAHTAVSPIEGRRIAITGGTTGIGRAIAVLLASYGARVFVCGRNKAHLKDALKRIAEVGEGAGLAVDLAKPKGVDAFFKAADAYLGGLDVAVINAAIPADGLTKTGKAELAYAIATDFTAYLASAHSARARLDKTGDIVLIGSMSAHTLGPSSTVYAGIKAGIAGFAEALRKELGSKGVRVSLIEPGMTQADFHYPQIGPRKQKQLVRDDAMLRSEDIAVAVHYILTQPRRTVVQQITVVPRVPDE